MRPERARCAGILSFWLPGLGQLYLHRWWRGAALLAASWFASALAWDDCSVAWSAAALVVWVVAVCDAGSVAPASIADRD